MKIYSFIFARGGSKGVPRKNVKKLAGKPLVAYSIEISKEIESISRIFVSTEDEEISKTSKDYGAEIIKRPPELAKDDSPEWLSWQHAIDWVEKKYGSFDVFVSLPTTSPLRNKNDVINCLNTFHSKSDVVIGITEAKRSPWFNMVKKDSAQNLHLILNDDKNFYNRQEVPEAFDMTTISYVSSPEFIKKSKSIFDGNVAGVYVPAERSLDIDSSLDFEIAEFLLTKNGEPHVR